MKYLPNAITILRLFMIPVFIWIFFSDSAHPYAWALVVYLLAGVSDMLDGYLARKYDVVSVVGIVLDPLADKLMLLTALACLMVAGIMPIWALTVMLIIEGIQIVSGIVLYIHPRQDVIPANKFGKAATVLFSISVSLMMLVPDLSWTHFILVLAIISKAISFGSYGLHLIKRQNNKESIKK